MPKLERFDLSQKAKPRPYLVRGWIPERALVLHSGDTATLKSIIAGVDLPRAIVQGGQWLGQPVLKRGPVCVFNAENDPEYEELPRYGAIQPPLTREHLAGLHYYPASPLSGIDPDRWAATVTEKIQEAQAVLAIVDAAASAGPLHEGNSNDDVSAFMARLKAIVWATGCTLVLITHEKKPQPGASRRPRDRVLGARQYVAQADWHLANTLENQTVEAQDDGSRMLRSVVRLDFGKTRGTIETEPLRALVESEETADRELRHMTVRRLTEDEAASLKGPLFKVIDALQRADTAMRRSDLLTATRLPESTLDRTLKQGLARGVLCQPEGQRGPYALAADYDEQEPQI